MNASIFKRIAAYLLDVLIVFLLSSMLSAVLPNNDKINAKSDEALNILDEFMQSVDEGDTTAMDEIAEQIDDINYDVQKLSIYSTLSTAVLYFLYFIVFESYNNGQTLGKRLLKIEVNDKDGQNASFRQILIRGLILYPIVLDVLNVVLISTLAKSTYLNWSSTLMMLYYCVFLLCFFTMLFKKRGLHDLLAGTVVLDASVDDESKVAAWQNSAEKSHEEEAYRKNHTSGKKKG